MTPVKRINHVAIVLCRAVYNIVLERKDTKNWIALAEYDLETALHMLGTRRYLYVVILCHLVLEKI